eukprot:5539915-Pleurochrysis_carterae.AAC.1
MRRGQSNRAWRRPPPRSGPGNPVWEGYPSNLNIQGWNSWATYSVDDLAFDLCRQTAYSVLSGKRRYRQIAPTLRILPFGFCSHVLSAVLRAVDRRLRRCRAVAQTLRAVAGYLCYALSLAARSGHFHRPTPYANSPLAPCAVPLLPSAWHCPTHRASRQLSP